MIYDTEALMRQPVDSITGVVVSVAAVGAAVLAIPIALRAITWVLSCIPVDIGGYSPNGFDSMDQRTPEQVQRQELVDALNGDDPF